MKNQKKLSTKDICMLGIGIALYIICSAIMKIPLIGHIQTDLGYIVFAIYCIRYGWIAAVVGACGCTLVSLLFSGWFPPGWILGQIFIGVFCGIIFKNMLKTDMKYRPIYMILVSCVIIFIGIGGIKTVIECILYSIPLPIKFMKNTIAAIADMIPFAIGILIGLRIYRNLE